jgi:hypothetical protein
VQIGWQDSSYVLFLSTVHTGADEERTQRKRRKPATKGSYKKEKEIQRYFGNNSSMIIAIPTVAASYNDEMNHVDRGDQLRSYTSYEHRFRRGPWQALLWSFLLDIDFTNGFILQLKTTSPRWPPYKTLQKWKECIYNALFITYAHESSARKRYRTGKEEDIGDIETHEKHIQRDIDHVWRGVKSDCLACKGFKQGQPRPFKKRKLEKGSLQPTTGDARKTRGRQTKYGCKVCDVAICNRETCWYFYHTPN